jgi:hypothetical protein
MKLARGCGGNQEAEVSLAFPADNPGAEIMTN